MGQGFQRVPKQRSLERQCCYSDDASDGYGRSYGLESCWEDLGRHGLRLDERFEGRESEVGDKTDSDLEELNGYYEGLEDGNQERSLNLKLKRTDNAQIVHSSREYDRDYSDEDNHNLNVEEDDDREEDDNRDGGEIGSQLYLYVEEDDNRDGGETGNQLCIPQDRLEDIEMFPNFTDDFMSMSGYFLGPDFDNYPCNSPQKYLNNPTIAECRNDILSGKVTKKRRTRCKRRPREIVYNYMHSYRDGDLSKKQQCSSYPDDNLPKKQQCSSYPDDNLPKKQQCSHCKAEKTPQWRAGPLGPKTLCNACGVRYRLKKLVPEYRPLASPTFDSKKHSNYHRKIERMINRNPDSV